MLPEVDQFIETKCQAFSRPIVERLRTIYLAEGLVEEYKWNMPCYSHHGLVCSIGAFKKHVSSWFFKGSLLHDPSNVLRKAQKDTKGMRSLNYTEHLQIEEKLVRNFVKEAMILNEKGIEVKIEKAPPLVAPDYMLKAIQLSDKAMNTYEHFTPSKRKEYIRWITEAKREETRLKRIEKMLTLLEAGKGLNDKYR